MMIDDVNAALSQHPDDKNLIDLHNRLYYIADAHTTIDRAKLDMLNPAEDETYDKITSEECHKEYNKSVDILKKFTKEVDNNKSPFKERLAEISDQHIPKFRDQLKAHESSKYAKDHFYYLMVGEGEHESNPDKFKEDLLAYLSGAIILKDHRYRYQQEQYERYLDFNRWIRVSNDMTLKKFAEMYARSLRTQVEISHNFLCPQIDANYDDYGKRTVNPINSTVFYFFFSAHRARRKFAQVILSAARYPNEKIRRAYMRFFSNA